MAEARRGNGRRPPLPPGPYLVLGLGRSGRAAAEMLRHLGAQVRGVDCGWPGRLERLKAAGVSIHTGGEPDHLLEGVRTVVKSPGVHPNAPLLEQARARGATVIGELELAWRLLPTRFVAVTGTNGKTTTVELLGHLFRCAGRSVAVAGNVGLPLSLLVGAQSLPPTVICEVSSFQLEDGEAFAPEVGVLLNLTPDHLDHHGSFEAYRAAKFKLFAHQREGDLAVVNEALRPAVEAIPRKATVVGFGSAQSAAFWRRGYLYHRLHGGKRARRLLAQETLQVRGAHNLQNALAAATVALLLGLPEEAVREGLITFRGVEHRLEELPGPDGLTYVNDSKATNLAATAVALRAYGPGSGRKLIHLILGGQRKGQDFRRLRGPIGRYVKCVYLIGEDEAEIAQALSGVAVELRRCGTLERAVQEARQAGRNGELVLLSPGCASFDQFESFEARGRRFRELVYTADLPGR